MQLWSFDRSDLFRLLCLLQEGVAFLQGQEPAPRHTGNDDAAANDSAPAAEPVPDLKRDGTMVVTAKVSCWRVVAICTCCLIAPSTL